MKVVLIHLDITFIYLDVISIHLDTTSLYLAIKTIPLDAHPYYHASTWCPDRLTWHPDVLPDVLTQCNNMMLDLAQYETSTC